ncbi:MAG: rhomboid family intramembrane serine protease [Roseobacter sp.]|jgi:membrane associated rhomboid family serine protease|nr:rhomboid family intramembrane serine protease [Roseobacter sp.]
MFRFDRTREGPVTGLWLLWSIILTCCLIEAVLQITDSFALAQRLRAPFYENGGFWVGLLYDWQPNYAAQPYTMFLTYGFLHGGLLHLAVNMITLWSLGSAVLDRVGTRGCALLYFGATVGGAAGQALLATESYPVVGASGALFGLAGGLAAWTYVDRYTHHETLWPVAQTLVFLVVLNIVLWWGLDGRMAWQTHLGGFVSGWIIALLIDPRAHPADRPSA